MKPTEPNIQYCLKHKEDVARWLEQRGGWQEGDWGWDTDEDELLNPQDGDTIRLLSHVWLPDAGDVLEMLGFEELAIYSYVQDVGTRRFCARLANGMGKYGDTRLIALMELLRASES